MYMYVGVYVYVCRCVCMYVGVYVFTDEDHVEYEDTVVCLCVCLSVFVLCISYIHINDVCGTYATYTCCRTKNWRRPKDHSAFETSYHPSSNLSLIRCQAMARNRFHERTFS